VQSALPACKYSTLLVRGSTKARPVDLAALWRRRGEQRLDDDVVIARHDRVRDGTHRQSRVGADDAGRCGAPRLPTAFRIVEIVPVHEQPSGVNADPLTAAVAESERRCEP
jgi:hypothetical protein